MSPPDTDMNRAVEPNVFRQIVIFYLLAFLALIVSFSVAGAIASILEIPLLFVWVIIAPLFIGAVLFLQLETFIERKIKARQMMPAKKGPDKSPESASES